MTIRASFHSVNHNLQKSLATQQATTLVQTYFLLINTLAAVLFTLLSISLYNLTFKHRLALITVVTIIVLLSIISIMSIIIAILQTIRLKPSSLDLTQQQFFGFQSMIQYIQFLPLAYISFFFFSQYNYLKSTKPFDYTVLIVCTIYFSVFGILNLVLTEIKLLENYLRFDTKKVLFLFLFRFFFFTSKLISIVLFFSTRSDYSFFSSDITENSTVTTFESHTHSIKILFIFLFYAISSYTIYFLWYFRVNKDKQTQFANIFFEPYKMLIDFNDNFFDRQQALNESKLNSRFKNDSSLEKFIRNLLNFNSITVIVYFFYNIASQLIFAYYWYFCSIVTLGKIIQSRINIFNILNSKTLLLNLNELEEILKFRQLLLVTVLGSILITILAYHIFYQYYFKNEFVGSSCTDNKINLRKHSLLEKARYPMKYELNTNDHTIDGFSIDSFHHSSTISTVSSTYEKRTHESCPPRASSINQLNLLTTQMYRNDIDSLSLSSDSSKFSSSFSFFSSINLDHNKATKIAGSDTSSGVNSSTTSLSSIYKQFNNLSSYEPYSTWEAANVNSVRNYKNLVTFTNQKFHNMLSVQSKLEFKNSNAHSVNEKVSSWFNQTKLSGLESSKSGATKCVGDISELSIISKNLEISLSLSTNLVESFVFNDVSDNNCLSPPSVSVYNLESNTDSTYKTEKSNLTYLI